MNAFQSINNIDSSACGSGCNLSLGADLTINGNGAIRQDFAVTNHFFSDGGSTGSIRFSGSSGTITSNGGTWFTGGAGTVTISTNASYTLIDNFASRSNRDFNVNGTLITGGKAINAFDLIAGNAATLTLSNSYITLNNPFGTQIQFQTGTTVTHTGTFEIDSPGVVNFNGLSTSSLIFLPVSASYSSSQRLQFTNNATFKQLDSAAGVFLQTTSGKTITITTCNIVGSSANHCNWNASSAGNNFNLCITNQNILYTDFTDVNFNCTAGVDKGGSCTSNCTSVTFPAVSAPTANAGEILLMI